MKDDLKLGIIGAWGRGMVGRHGHKPENGSRVTMCCDIREGAIKRCTEAFGPDVGFTTDYREMLKSDVDAVFIGTPDYLHEEQAIASLEAGKAVYLEKPLAITIEGCDRILETAKKTGTKLYLGHNMRHFASVLKMKEIIDSGTIGDIQAVWCRHFVAYGGDAYFKDWHSEQKYSTGLLLQKGAHDIDVIHWLAGGYTKRVTGMGKLSVYDKCAKRPAEQRGDASFNTEHWPPLSQTGMSPVIDVEDHSMILMQLDNGIQASYMQCHYSPDSGRNYTFIGTKGRIENIGDSGNCQIAVYTHRTDGSVAVPDMTYGLTQKMGGHGGSDPSIVQEFLDYVRGTRKPTTSPVAARYAVACGCCGTESLRSGSAPRDIPPLDPKIAAYFETH